MNTGLLAALVFGGAPRRGALPGVGSTPGWSSVLHAYDTAGRTSREMALIKAGLRTAREMGRLCADAQTSTLCGPDDPDIAAYGAVNGYWGETLLAVATRT